MINFFFAFFAVISVAIQKEEDLCQLLPGVIKEQKILAPLAFDKQKQTQMRAAIHVEILCRTISREFSSGICCSILMLAMNGDDQFTLTAPSPTAADDAQIAMSANTGGAMIHVPPMATALGNSIRQLPSPMAATIAQIAAPKFPTAQTFNTASTFAGCAVAVAVGAPKHAVVVAATKHVVVVATPKAPKFALNSSDSDDCEEVTVNITVLSPCHDTQVFKWNIYKPFDWLQRDYAMKIKAQHYKQISLYFNNKVRNNCDDI